MPAFAPLAGPAEPDPAYQSKRGIEAEEPADDCKGNGDHNRAVAKSVRVGVQILWASWRKGAEIKAFAGQQPHDGGKSPDHDAIHKAGGQYSEKPRHYDDEHDLADTFDLGIG